MHHPIFQKFNRVRSTGTGRHVFDFLGAATRVSFRKGWEAHAVPSGKEVIPGYPAVNEHYFDWIAVLTAVEQAGSTFRMAELGAGWAPWLTRAALATRQRQRIQGLELLAVEADESHYDWVGLNFSDNGLAEPAAKRVRAAACSSPGTIRFPKVHNPDENYGASLIAARTLRDFIEVPALTLSDAMRQFSGAIDLLHIDIQGAEYEIIPPMAESLRSSVKMMMVGTHISLDRHHDLAKCLRDAGWREIFNFPRHGTVDTDFGPVKFDDGFLLVSAESI
jgi:FkbM family methyltransferase